MWVGDVKLVPSVCSPFFLCYFINRLIIMRSVLPNVPAQGPLRVFGNHCKFNYIKKIWTAACGRPVTFSLLRPP